MSNLLANHLNPEYVILDLAARDKTQVLLELAHRLVVNNPQLNQEEILLALHQREADGTTGIGQGVALPHIRTPHTDKMLLAIGRSKEGIDFESLDQKPVHLFFLLLAPQEGTYLKILARISKLCMDSQLTRDLMTVESITDFLDRIQKELDFRPKGIAS